MTLKWVNKERAELNLPPISKLPPGVGGMSNACRIANAFVDAGPYKYTSIDYVGNVLIANNLKKIPIYAGLTALWFDFFGWRHKKQGFIAKDLEELYVKEKPKKEKKVKTVVAKKTMDSTDRKVLEIQAGLVEVQEQINALESSFMATSQDLRKRLRALEQEKREAENEIYS